MRWARPFPSRPLFYAPCQGCGATFANPGLWCDLDGPAFVYWCESCRKPEAGGAAADVELYDALITAGCEVDHHESDLYVKLTAEARRVLAGYRDRLTMARVFTSQIDGGAWLDVPFAYLPWWRVRAAHPGRETQVAP